MHESKQMQGFLELKLWLCLVISLPQKKNKLFESPSLKEGLTSNNPRITRRLKPEAIQLPAL